jgi:hypothetical protein
LFFQIQLFTPIKGIFVVETVVILKIERGVTLYQNPTKRKAFYSIEILATIQVLFLDMTSAAKSDSTRTRQFPSGPLSAVTRKKREIEDLLHSPETNKEKITVFFNVYLEKVERLLEACDELREKEDCRQDVWNSGSNLF